MYSVQPASIRSQSPFSVPVANWKLMTTPLQMSWFRFHDFIHLERKKLSHFPGNTNLLLECHVWHTRVAVTISHKILVNSQTLLQIINLEMFVWAYQLGVKPCNIKMCHKSWAHSVLSKCFRQSTFILHRVDKALEKLYTLVYQCIYFFDCMCIWMPVWLIHNSYF